MLFIVEVLLVGEFGSAMSQMRTWLDHMRYNPGSFRCVTAGTGTIFRVDFDVESEARAFAQAFGGRLLNETTANYPDVKKRCPDRNSAPGNEVRLSKPRPI